MFTGLLEDIEKPPNSLKKKLLSIVLKTSKVEQCRDGKCIEIFFYFQSSYSNDNYQKAYNFKEKMNNSEHWSLFMKKKIESYHWTKWNWRHVHSKSETKTNKQKQQQQKQL